MVTRDAVNTQKDQSLSLMIFIVFIFHLYLTGSLVFFVDSDNVNFSDSFATTRIFFLYIQKKNQFARTKRKSATCFFRNIQVGIHPSLLSYGTTWTLYGFRSLTLKSPKSEKYIS